MPRSILWRTRLRRFFHYVSGTYVAVFSAIVIPAVGIWHATSGRSGLWIIAGVSVGILLMILRNYLEYQRVIYDPHWALNFQDRFDAMNQGVRPRAAATLRDRKADLGDITNPALATIDDVLDFFEDIGLYQRADYISPELAHHHFFHWVRGYWQASEPYMQAWRKKEPARWNHVEELFETICDIELKQHGGKREQLMLSDSELGEFLLQEIGEVNDSPDADSEKERARNGRRA